MEKVLERVVELLPVPVLIALAALLIAGWSVKELRDLPSEAALLREPLFQVSALIAFAATITYYGSAAILSHSVPRRFSDKERGIIVSPLSGDKDGSVQHHTVESLREELSKAENLGDVVVLRINGVVEGTDGAQQIIERTNARALVWGSFLPPEVVHYTITTSKGETKIPTYSFKDVNLLTGKVVQFLQLTPPPSGSSTEDQVAFYRRKIADLEQQNQSLVLQVGKHQTGPSEIPVSGHKTSVMSIGVSDYAELPRLRWSVSDARAISDAFRSSSDSEVITLTDPTRASILRALSSVRVEHHSGTFLFYFSGAAANVGNTTYLFPVDARLDSPAETAISFEELARFVKHIEAKYKVIVLDTSVSLSNQTAMLTETKPSPLSTNLRTQNTAILAATSSGESAVESASLNHGVFTFFLLKGLAGEADLNRDGIITATELFDYVRANVARSSTELGFPQHPTFSSNSDAPIPILTLTTRPSARQ
jgi:hypothetical protein